MLHFQKLCIAIFCIFSVYSYAQSVIGYKDFYYQIDSNDKIEVCEYDKKFVKQWCVPTETEPMGLYVGFKQLLVYSKTSIEMVDTVRKTIKWSIPLEDIYKIHIKFPVIITFSSKRTLKGYDYFTGYELWQKDTEYKNLFESGVDVWVTSNNAIEKLDVLSSEVTNLINVDGNISNIHGDNLYLFIEKDGQLFHMNVVDTIQHPIGQNYSVIDSVSDYILVGNDDEQQLVTYSNEPVSSNVQETLITIHTPTKRLFSYIKDDQIFFIGDTENIIYDFTRTKKHDKIDYGYKLNDEIRVFSGSEQDIWTLKQIKKEESDQDT